ncbi:accessory Sec system protein Asp2 [Leuconostoc lactis]|uniref:accessory Sec system protein Asp2 n=1 Tax=Leuconostoc lactis TaxID=1246 RepID=UPI0033150755
MAEISVLQIGVEDWTPQIKTAKIDWQYTTILDLPTRLALQKDPYVLEQTYVVLTDETLDSTLLSSQISDWPARRVLYFAQQITPEFQAILDERQDFRIAEKTPQAVAERILSDFQFEQIGFSTRFSETQFIPMPPETTHFERQGRFSAHFSGDFGDAWQQIGALKTFAADFAATTENVVWLDYEQSGTAEVQLQFVFFRDGHIQLRQTVTGDQLRQLTTVGGLQDYDNYQIIVLARGHGVLDLHVLHQRRSRHGVGVLMPGDDWQLTAENEEILSYFDPGDRQAPLIVNFSGIRLHVDGFEMRGPLRELGTPYLLFTDTRMQGGAFDIGTELYEKTVIETIKRAMATLNLKPEDVILTGYSMGSFPAMYYAADIKPRAVVIAKPIINLGTFTANPDFPHGYNQDWTLDVRRYLAGRMAPEDTEPLNQIFWEHIQNVDWSKIAVELLTMTDDEYDGQSLPELLAFFQSRDTPLTHEQEIGTHTAKIPEMVQFMTAALAKWRDIIRQEAQ